MSHINRLFKRQAVARPSNANPDDIGGLSGRALAFAKSRAKPRRRKKGAITTLPIGRTIKVPL